MNVELQRSKRAHPFCTHIDKIKPFEAKEMPISWLQDAVGDTSQIGTDVNASDEYTARVGDMVRTQRGYLVLQTRRT